MNMKQNYQTNITTRGSSQEQMIDGFRAKSIARRFLERYHSLIIFKEVILEEKTWKVVMDVGYKEDNIIQVLVDSTTGKILG